MRYAVRCSQTQEVLGWLEVLGGLVGPVLHFTVSERVERSTPRLLGTSAMDERIPLHVVEVRDFVHGDGSVERAVYSEGRPLEFWQKIRGFIPA